jgi:hypothetical protein
MLTYAYTGMRICPLHSSLPIEFYQRVFDEVCMLTYDVCQLRMLTYASHRRGLYADVSWLHMLTYASSTRSVC